VLILSLDHAEMEENEFTEVTLTANYSRALGSGITGATLTVDFNGNEITLTEQGDGIYTATLTTTDLARNTYALTVDAVKDNYVSRREATNLIIAEPTIFFPFIGKVAVSTVISSMFTFVLPFVGFAGIIAYKRITMPYPLKIINKAIRIIQKGDTFDVESVSLENREALVQNMIVSEYASIMGTSLDTSGPEEDLIEEET
jgi:hypothetical protein